MSEPSIRTCDFCGGVLWAGTPDLLHGHHIRLVDGKPTRVGCKGRVIGEVA